MILLAYPTLGLPGAAVRFMAQYAAADDWQHVVGFMKLSSWLAFGCGALVATLAIGAAPLFKSHLDPAYVEPTIVALAGIPIVALTIVRSELIRRSRVACACVGALPAWTTPVSPYCDRRHFGRRHDSHCHHGRWPVFIVAYAASSVIAQWGIVHGRLGTRSSVEHRIQLVAVARICAFFLLDLPRQYDPSPGCDCGWIFSEAPRRGHL